MRVCVCPFVVGMPWTLPASQIMSFSLGNFLEFHYKYSSFFSLHSFFLEPLLFVYWISGTGSHGFSALLFSWPRFIVPFSRVSLQLYLSSGRFQFQRVSCFLSFLCFWRVLLRKSNWFSAFSTVGFPFSFLGFSESLAPVCPLTFWFTDYYAVSLQLCILMDLCL